MLVLHCSAQDRENIPLLIGELPTQPISAQCFVFIQHWPLLRRCILLRDLPYIEMVKVRLMNNSNKSVIKSTVIHSNTCCDNWLIYLSAQACNSVVKSSGLALYFKYCQVKPSIWSSSSFKSATLWSSSLFYSPWSPPPTSPPLCQHLANSSPFTRIFSIEKTFSLLLETSLHWPSRKLLDHLSR